MKALLFSLILAAVSWGLQAQDPKDPSHPFAHYIVPFESGLTQNLLGSWEPELRYRVWSIRDARWYEFRNGEVYFLSDNGYACMFKGDPILKAGVEGEFQIAFSSPYKGKHQFVYEQESGQALPVEKETIYMEDDVELVWELRASPGIEILSYPTPPNHPVRWKEPVLAPFRIRVTDLKEGQELSLYLYINAYHDGKLVGFSGHVYGVNHVGFLDNEDGIRAFKACRGKWTEADLERERRCAAEVPRLRPLKKGQTLLDTRPTSRFPLDEK